MDSFQDKMKEWIEKVSNTNTVTDTEMQKLPLICILYQLKIISTY